MDTEAEWHVAVYCAVLVRLELPSREINPLIRLPRENPPDLPFHPCHGGMSGIVNVQSLSRFLHGSILNDLSRDLG